MSSRKLTKRKKFILENLEDRFYTPEEAFAWLKQKQPPLRFNQTVELAVRLGINPRKSVVKGSVILPHGTGKEIRVAVFAQGEHAEQAEQAGADRVGFEDLAEDIRQGNIDYHVVIATPDAMKLVGRLGPILGKRGLMPNPKMGTVTVQVADAVKNAKAGQVRFRNDKTGIVHSILGKLDFSVEHLVDNLKVFIQHLKKIKPSTAKGIYLCKVTVSSTMGPGIEIDLSSL